MYSALLGARGGVPFFLRARLGGTRGGGTGVRVGLGEGVFSLLALVPQRGLCKRLQGRLHAVLHEVGELLYGLWGVCVP